MTGKHLTDEEIQEYVLGETLSGDLLVNGTGDRHTADHIPAHLGVCESCRAKAASYRQLFIEIGQQEPPVFDFDPAELVMAQIGPIARNRFSNSWMVALAIAGIGIPLFVMRENLLKLVAGASSMLLYAGGIAFLAVAVFQGIDIYRSYQRKIDALDLY